MTGAKGGSGEKAGSGGASRIDAPGLERVKGRMGNGAEGPLWRKWAWFVGLWTGGVLVVGSIGWLLRWWLHP